MIISCKTEILTEACLNIQRSVPSKAVLPHLEGILIETVGDSSIKLSGFDLEIATMTVIDNIDIEEDGAVVLNAKTLCDILRHIPNDTVEIFCNKKNVCIIKSGEVEYTLISLNPAEYPEISPVVEERSFNINSAVLKDMIKKTVFAVSVDDGKTVHRGVKFELTAGEIKLVALDGYRMAIRREFIENNGNDISFIIPSKTLYEVMKLATDDDSFINISIGSKHIIFEIGNYSLLSKLLEGEFLDYNSALPKNIITTIRINTKKLIDSIERTSIIITEKVKSPIKCIFENDELKISAVTALGSANDKINVSVDGERTEIGFNNKYLIDALRNCDADEILMEISGPFSPALIVPIDGDSFLFLILPVKI